MDKMMENEAFGNFIALVKNTDVEFYKLTRLIGKIELIISDHYFESLVMSILGQQLSAIVAGRIRDRVRRLCTEIMPEQVKSIPFEQLRGAGVSKQKISYLYDLCEKVIHHQINFSNFDQLDDDEIIKRLTTVKGIGKWTAEMFLIFSLGRTGVLSCADAGLQRATKWLYRMGDRLDGKYLEQHGHRWSPYQSVASLYLWEAIDRGYVNSGLNIEQLSEKLPD